jgi:hypothetical protein
MAAHHQVERPVTEWQRRIVAHVQDASTEVAEAAAGKLRIGGPMFGPASAVGAGRRVPERPANTSPPPVSTSGAADACPRQSRNHVGVTPWGTLLSSPPLESREVPALQHGHPLDNERLKAA